jgi:hypothetical protein
MTEPSFTIKRIVYFVESYFNARDYERFGIQTFIDNGYDVEVWDFTPFMASGSYLEKISPPDFECSQWILFQNKRDAIEAVSKLTQTCFVISLIHYAPESLRIHRLLSKKEIPYCVDTMALPAVDHAELDVSVRINRKLRVLNCKVLLNTFFYRIPHKALGVRSADYVLARGEKYGTPGLVVNEKAEIIWAHSYDYDTCLKEADNNPEDESNTGVFIDEYLPFHPDYAYMGFQAPVTPEEYYPKLCRFFRYLEDDFGFEIVIAGHPRSRYEDHPDYYEKRPIYRGKTISLVKKSKFVIMHTSTAINFAVLYKKPVVFVTTDKYNEGWTEDPTPDWLAGYFGKTPHNLDYPLHFNLHEELHVDEKVYNAYRNAYIKKDGTKNLFSWQILADRIKSINDMR